MSLNELRDEAAAFLGAVDPAGAERVPDILRMLDEEYQDLKASLGDRERFSHQVYDVLFLVFELAAKRDIDLDREWALGRERKRKYTES